MHDDTMRGAAAGHRRRDALKLAGLAAAGLVAAAGCGTSQAAPQAQALTGPAGPWSRQRKHGHVNFANWPYYIDTGQATLHEFTGATGITVTYAEVIQDDPSWFAKVSPIIRAHESIGYDVMVITNGFQFSELVALHELMPLDQSMMANFYRYASPNFQHRSFDPGNTYSVPWASGSTGIAWNPKYIKTPVTSMNDLWNPAYKGRVGMMSDLQDLGNFGMIRLGIDPEKSSPSDWRRAARVLTQQRDAGLVRGYYQQPYLNALASGETWISMAWSGDIFQSNLTSGTDLKFVVPAEGGTIWTDNMVIPRGAQNPVERHDADGLVLPAAGRGPADRVDQLHHRRPLRAGHHRGRRPQVERHAEIAAAPGRHQRPGLAHPRRIWPAAQLRGRERQGAAGVHVHLPAGRRLVAALTRPAAAPARLRPG